MSWRGTPGCRCPRRFDARAVGDLVASVGPPIRAPGSWHLAIAAANTTNSRDVGGAAREAWWPGLVGSAMPMTTCRRRTSIGSSQTAEHGGAVMSLMHSEPLGALRGVDRFCQAGA